eukprot:30536-Pelagococcus_subviridis.AAC.2
MNVGVELKGVRSGVERRHRVGCAGKKSPQGTAFTTPTRSYGDQCEENAPAGRPRRPTRPSAPPRGSPSARCRRRRRCPRP